MYKVDGHHASTNLPILGVRYKFWFVEAEKPWVTNERYTKNLSNLPAFNNFLDFVHKWGLLDLKPNHSTNSFVLGNFLHLLSLSQVLPQRPFAKNIFSSFQWRYYCLTVSIHTDKQTTRSISGSSAKSCGYP